ncbi:DUF4880 domain-containing protein [Tistrella bauzanensis]
MTGPLPPQTAADWLVVLLDAPDDAGLAAAFARWHAADPRHADDWAALARTYQVMGMAMPVHEAAWRDARRTDAGGTGPRPLPSVHTPSIARPPTARAGARRPWSPWRWRPALPSPSCRHRSPAGPPTTSPATPKPRR